MDNDIEMLGKHRIAYGYWRFLTMLLFFSDATALVVVLVAIQIPQEPTARLCFIATLALLSFHVFASIRAGYHKSQMEVFEYRVLLASWRLNDSHR